MSYSLPQNAPLFGRPPYAYAGYRKLSVVCRANAESLAASLPAQLALESDLIEVFVMDVPDAGSLGRYREGGIVAKVRYGEHVGGHVLYEYVTSDDSMAAGREIWGYPKKMCEVDWVEGDKNVTARVLRRGVELISLNFQPSDIEYPRLDLQPRLQIKRIPSADGQGDDVDRVVRNQLRGGVIHQRVIGDATVRLGGSVQDPLNELKLNEVLGGEFIVADFELEFGQYLN